MFIILFFIIVFFIGLAFGSFLNSLVYRLGKRESILGRSFCPKCKKQIAWYDNIPVISFIFLNGKCRKCKKKISIQYPIIELIVGFLFVFAFYRVNNSVSVISYALFTPSIVQYLGFAFAILREWIIFFTLAFIFIYDLKYSKIEDIVLLPCTALVFVLNLVTPELFNFLNSASILIQVKTIIFTIIISVGFFALQYLFTKGKGIGLGDLRIGLFIGVVLIYYQHLLVAILFSYIIGATISILLIALNKKTIKSQIPLGPFLTIGTFVAMVYAQRIIEIFF